MTIVVVSDFGSYIGKSKEQFRITHGMSEKPVSFIPAVKVKGILIDTKVTISSGAFQLLRNHGIPVICRTSRMTA